MSSHLPSSWKCQGRLFPSEVWYSDLCTMIAVLFKGRKMEKLKCFLERSDWNPGNAAPTSGCVWDLVPLILILHYPGISGYHRGERGSNMDPSESPSWVMCRAWAGEAGCPSWLIISRFSSSWLTAVCVCVRCSVVSDPETRLSVAYQVALSKGFFRQECWSGLSFPFQLLAAAWSKTSCTRCESGQRTGDNSLDHVVWVHGISRPFFPLNFLVWWYIHFFFFKA